MEIYRLRSFVLLAERLNFGETARLSNLSQPALSKQIRQLEVEIGAPLFDRGRHGAQLTAVGKLFAEEARLVVRQADLALERLISDSSGSPWRKNSGPNRCSKTDSCWPSLYITNPFTR